MLYEIKNKRQNDITIGTKTLKYNDVTIVDDLEPLQKLIDLNYIEVVNSIHTNISNNTIQPIVNHNIVKSPNSIVENFINDKIKMQLSEIFFNFYLHNDISNDDLTLLKWFYKKIGFTHNISQKTLDLIDDVTHQEELIEILLNNIYPELFDQYTLEEKDK